MQDYFYSLSDKLFKKLMVDELLLVSFSGEDTDFVRLNHNRIRQAGCVAQRKIALDLVKGQRHAEIGMDLSGRTEQDLRQLIETLGNLRHQLEFLPEDPFLSFATDINHSAYHHDDEVIDSHEAIEQILQLADGMDLVGIFANGSQYSGFANSMGQRNWHSTRNFNFDWSCYHASDKAVKGSYAGFVWQHDRLRTTLDSIQQQLAIVARPAKTISPGGYRVYLAPSAVQEILDLLSWGGFGLKSHRTKNTPLIQMQEQGRYLASSINLYENHARGLAPIFTRTGFIKPTQVKLIEAGHYQDCLVNSRSAAEYDCAVNAECEYPESLDLAAGHIAKDDVLNELDTGLYIGNLWYLNFSDRNACQFTGMTRFACFWVENGEVQAPVNVMRFDDSVYDLLGTNLLGLTRERELLLDPTSYGSRSNSSIELPGALLKSMRFTL
jgi:predicted Zn-dependent protease